MEVSASDEYDDGEYIQIIQKIHKIEKKIRKSKFNSSLLLKKSDQGIEKNNPKINMMKSDTSSVDTNINLNSEKYSSPSIADIDENTEIHLFNLNKYIVSLQTLTQCTQSSSLSLLQPIVPYLLSIPSLRFKILNILISSNLKLKMSKRILFLLIDTFYLTGKKKILKYIIVNIKNRNINDEMIKWMESIMFFEMLGCLPCKESSDLYECIFESVNGIILNDKEIKEFFLAGQNENEDKTNIANFNIKNNSYRFNNSVDKQIKQNYDDKKKVFFKNYPITINRPLFAPQVVFKDYTLLNENISMYKIIPSHYLKIISTFFEKYTFFIKYKPLNSFNFIMKLNESVLNSENIKNEMKRVIQGYGNSILDDLFEDENDDENRIKNKKQKRFIYNKIYFLRTYVQLNGISGLISNMKKCDNTGYTLDNQRIRDYEWTRNILEWINKGCYHIDKECQASIMIDSSINLDIEENSNIDNICMSNKNNDSSCFDGCTKFHSLKIFNYTLFQSPSLLILIFMIYKKIRMHKCIDIKEYFDLIEKYLLGSIISLKKDYFNYARIMFKTENDIFDCNDYKDYEIKNSDGINTNEDANINECVQTYDEKKHLKKRRIIESDSDNDIIDSKYFE